MKTYFITDQGQVRSINEDAGGVFYNSAGQVLAIVADGMGGHKAGEVASRLAVSVAQSKWHETDNIKDEELATEWLQETIAEANDAIFQQSKDQETLTGMGTTIVAAICSEDFLTVAHVGDSRAYLIEEGDIKRLTRDHSLVEELVRTGQISEADAEVHPRKNVLLRAMGTEEEVEAAIITASWKEEDALLLCSDGLTNKIDDTEIEDLFATYNCHETLAKELAHVANERGGEDNITLSIVDYVRADESGDASC